MFPFLEYDIQQYRTLITIKTFISCYNFTQKVLTIPILSHKWASQTLSFPKRRSLSVSGSRRVWRLRTTLRKSPAIESLAWATPHSAREGRGLVTFACCTGISFTRIALVLRPHNYRKSTHVTGYCAVIGPALHSARQQTAEQSGERSRISWANYPNG